MNPPYGKRVGNRKSLFALYRSLGQTLSEKFDGWAKSVAERLQVGAVSINDASLTGIVNDVEKNSFRFSGMGGSRMGPAGLTRFLRKRALLIQTGEPAPVQLFSDTLQEPMS